MISYWSRRKELILALGFSIAIHAIAAPIFFLKRPAAISEKPTFVVELVVPKAIASVSRPKDFEKHPRSAKKQLIGFKVRSGIPRPNGLLKSSVIDLFPKMGVSEKFDEEGSDLNEKRNNSHIFENHAWSAKISRGGRVEFEDKLPISPGGVNLAFDLTELAMRMRGDTIYVPQKRKFLAESSETRVEMARHVNKENLIQSVLDLRSRLLTIWDNEHLTLAEKKQKLFAIWDECAEEGSEDILNMGSMIRISVVGFIGRHLPLGSELAYSEADLEKLNGGRQSQAEFVPY